MRRIFNCITLSLLVFIEFTSIASQAYTLATTSTGIPVRFRYGQKLFLAGNPAGIQNFPAEAFKNAVIDGLLQWKWATHNAIDFDYWQGTSPTYQASLDQNGQSSIFFLSHSKVKMDQNIIGYTQVWFDTQSGAIMESDIVINDRDYELTTTPSDTASHRSSFSRRPKVYLNNIVTHELGHAIGLSHSASLNSSMLYVEFLEQAKLGCDDWAGARHLYPSKTKGLGSLSGTLLSPAGEKVSGAVVTAISKQRGIPIASVHTNLDGKFYFAALETGTYALMFQPFQGANSAVPIKYQVQKTQNVCFENYFPTQFLSQRAESHTPLEVRVEDEQNSFLGDLSLHCNSINSTLQNDASDTSLSLTTASFWVDQAQAGTSKTYRFLAQGDFKITGLSYLILSPVNLKLEVFDQNHDPLPVNILNPLYESESSFKILDTQISGHAFGTIEIRVTSSFTNLENFPASGLRPESTPFFMLIFNSTPTAPTSELPNNARCTPPPQSRALYALPSGDPQRSDAPNTRDAIGFCGNAHAAEWNATSKKPHPAPPLSLATFLSWFFPFLTAIGLQLVLAVRRRRDKLNIR